MENPFLYGEVVRGEHFADRRDEIQELSADLSRGQNLILFSPRRFGKTSLILEVLDKLRNQGLITVYVDLYKVISKQKFIEVYAKAVSTSYSGKLERILKELKSILPHLIPKIIIRGEGEQEFEFSWDFKDEAPLINELFESVNNVAQNKRKRAVVVFDEFQEITNWDNGEIEREMRSHFQMHRDVAYVFVGSKRHLMKDIFRNKNRPFYRFGKHFPLNKIPAPEFSKFIAQKFQEGGFSISEEAIKKILESTESHPYYTQLLCSILWDKLIEIKKIGISEVDKGIDEIIKRESHAYNDLWDMLSIRAKQLLEALAVEPSAKIFSKKFLFRHNLGPPSTIQRVVRNLEKEEIIERENETYAFTDIFFKLWIAKRVI